MAGSLPPAAQLAATLSTDVEITPSAPAIFTAPPSVDTLPSIRVPLASRTATALSVVIETTSLCLIVIAPA